MPKAATTRTSKAKKSSPNAYILFTRHTNATDKTLSSMPLSERARTIGARWKDMSVEDRRPFMEEAAALKKEVEAANIAVTATSEERPEPVAAPKSMTAYQAFKAQFEGKGVREAWKALSKEEKAAFKVSKKKSPAKEKKAELLRKEAKVGCPRPKRALTGYMRFGKEERVKLREEKPDLSQTEITVLIGNRWRELSEEEKLPYNEAAKEDRARVAAAQKEWDEKAASSC